LPPASRPRRTAPAFAVNAIETAAQKILVSSYALTAGSGIVEALVRAKQRGVDVKLIADKTTPCEYKSGIDPLTRAGVPVWIDQGVRIAHAKAMVIDVALTLMGSMNWTAGAARNSEDLTPAKKPSSFPKRDSGFDGSFPRPVAAVEARRSRPRVWLMMLPPWKGEVGKEGGAQSLVGTIRGILCGFPSVMPEAEYLVDPAFDPKCVLYAAPEGYEWESFSPACTLGLIWRSDGAAWHREARMVCQFNGKVYKGIACNEADLLNGEPFSKPRRSPCLSGWKAFQ